MQIQIDRRHARRYVYIHNPMRDAADLFAVATLCNRRRASASTLPASPPLPRQLPCCGVVVVVNA